MGEKITFDKGKTIILLYIIEKRMWEDKTASIVSLYKAYYYNHFTGYNVYFKRTESKFFYKEENIQILKYLKNVSFENKDIIVNNEFVKAKTIEAFEKGYYRVTTATKTITTNNLKIKSGKYQDIYAYYQDLAMCAESIAGQDEPLYYLSQNYKRIQPKVNSVLQHYLEGTFTTSADDKGVIIVPFDYNQSQYNAIEMALTHNISIIEGPPGTGKTQTILNLISNILIRHQTCAVVSNNNAAIDNIYDKLNEEGLAFIAASLGKLENVDKFFEAINDDDLTAFLKSEFPLIDYDTLTKIKELGESARRIHRLEIEFSLVQNELNDIEIEQRNYYHHENSLIKISQHLTANDCLKLKQRIEEPRFFSFIEKWLIYFKYRLKINKLNLNHLLDELESQFYQKRILELRNKIKQLTLKMDDYHKEHTLQALKQLSKDYLFQRIQNRYMIMEKRSFDKESYKLDYDNFLKRYPVVLSTSQSLLNNARKGFLFDYLIIDEASQCDLLSSILAMSCARKMVVVGDSRQLQQIDEVRLLDVSQQLANKYTIPSSYRYDQNSVLKSVKNSIDGVPVTLLKEHYRCAPDIINFCNKMFYDGELIPMRKNEGQHIEIIKTVPGNHARKNPLGSGMYNQREIDEMVNYIPSQDGSRVGVITPFRYQAKLINDQLNVPRLEADTIHKFQGRQKDEIYLSFVVNSLDKDPSHIENRLYDFVTNEKLLNVAISRGKNKVTAIVSDKVYYSKNNIIHDFIHYAETLYGDTVTKTSSITSVLDYLYSENDALLKKLFHNNPKVYYTELLMNQLIEETLVAYNKIGYSMHVRLSKLITQTNGLDENERTYVMHPWTHVDFLFFNRISKERLFVLEVDGIRYHEQSENQMMHDEIKDKVLVQNGIPIYRFKTNESNEKERLNRILRDYVY